MPVLTRPGTVWYVNRDQWLLLGLNHNTTLEVMYKPTAVLFYH